MQIKVKKKERKKERKLLLQKQELNYKSNPHGRSTVLGSYHLQPH